MSPKCHPEREHKARGMCIACYSKDRRSLGLSVDMRKNRKRVDKRKNRRREPRQTIRVLPSVCLEPKLGLNVRTIREIAGPVVEDSIGERWLRMNDPERLRA